MSPQIENAIRNIFTGYLNLQLQNRLIDHLKTYESDNADILTPINTQNDRGEARDYFDCFHQSIMTNIAFIAGGIQNSFPHIRFDKQNVALKLVDGFTFQYYKEEQIHNTVCVKLREETIDLLPILLWCQLQWFESQNGH